jgi:GNAT superfamily N-acetyltransferase
VVARTRFVVELDGRAVGVAAGGDSSNPGAAALTSLWVEPAARGHGVGDLLVTTVVEWARRAGYKEVFLWVAAGNDSAERLYARNGFARTGAVVEDPQPEFEMSRVL